MSYHSEEIWESFDALARQVHSLSRMLKEMEMRIGVLEQAESALSENRIINSQYEGEVQHERSNQ
jgi:hypothetical protein